MLAELLLIHFCQESLLKLKGIKKTTEQGLFWLFLSIMCTFFPGKYSLEMKRKMGCNVTVGAQMLASRPSHQNQLGTNNVSVAAAKLLSLLPTEDQRPGRVF